MEMTMKQKNEMAIANLNAEIEKLDNAIPFKLANGDDVTDELTRLDGLQREKRMRIQAVKVLEKAEKRAYAITRKKERVAALELAQKTAKSQQAAFLKAYEDILAAYQKADAKRLALMETMKQGGFNEVQGCPAHVALCDQGQLFRMLSHGGVNLPDFIGEIRSKLEMLPDAMSATVAGEVAELANMEAEGHAV